MKKTLSIILCLVMVLSVFTIVPFTASAQETDLTSSGYTEGDFTYEVDDGEATVTGYTGSATELVIPSTLGDYPVTEIGWEAFRGCTLLKSVNIADVVTEISPFAFYGCTSLKSVTIPNSVTAIEYYAFYSCTLLESVTIPDSVTTIGDWAFARCTSLKTIDVSENNQSLASIGGIVYDKAVTKVIAVPGGIVTASIPDTVTEISHSAFRDCTSLESVIIGNSVTEIGSYMFTDCTSLESVTIGNSVTKIGNNAFFSCTSLESISIPDSVTKIGYLVFFRCTSLESITIGNSVTEIGSEAFYGCSLLENVTIGNSVTEIGSGAFRDCISLKSIDVSEKSQSLVSIGGIVYDKAVTKIIAVSGGIATASIPDSFTTIGSSAFSSCTLLENVTIYGYPDTAAEQYANENGFTFVPLSEHTDAGSGITVEAPTDNEVVITELPNTDTSYPLSLGEKVLKAYDIKLTKDAETVQPGDLVKVKIPCDNPDAKVYRVEANGSLTDMKAVYRDGYLVFYTDHFSLYVVAAPGDIEYILGDSDGDGVVSVLDATAIQKVRASIEINPFNESAADVDGDKVVSVIDATLIQKWLAKIPIKYPIGSTIE